MTGRGRRCGVARGWELVILLLAAFGCPGIGHAGNSSDVVGGRDVALTGGAVVANVQSGGALWFNPAGVARLDARSLDLTGSVVSYTIAKAPGMLSIRGGPKSPGESSAFETIPRALTFVASPRPNLRVGLGLFYVHTRDHFWQDAVTSAPQTDMAAAIQANRQQRSSTYHVSAAVGWKQSKALRIGVAFDAVVATLRLSEDIAGNYGGGALGAFQQSYDKSVSGGGLQVKIGVQWIPSQRVRIGWMVSTPTALVYVYEQSTWQQTRASALAPPVQEHDRTDELRPAFTTVEPGLTRFGVAFVDRFGSLELDAIATFPLRSEPFDLDLRAKFDLRAGGLFAIGERLKLGAGLFTDFSGKREPEVYGESRVDFYGMTVGVDFANGGQLPLAKGDSVFVALALAFRYAYGVGEVAGLEFPSASPGGPPLGTVELVALRVHEMSANLAFKAAF